MKVEVVGQESNRFNVATPGHIAEVAHNIHYFMIAMQDVHCTTLFLGLLCQLSEEEDDLYLIITSICKITHLRSGMNG